MFIYLLYSMFISVDIIIAISFTFHLFYPSSVFVVVGLPYLLTYPLLPALAPIWGVLGVSLFLFIAIRMFRDRHA